MPGPCPTPADSELPHPARTQPKTTGRRVIEAATLHLKFEDMSRAPSQSSPLRPARDARRRIRLDLPVDLLQNLEQRLVIRQLVDVVDVRIADDTILVHDKGRPFGKTLGTKDAILLGYFPMGPEIAQQENPIHAQRLGPGIVGVCAIHAYAQNLGIYRLEAFLVGLESGNLLRSDRRPGQWIEGDDDVLLALQVTEPNVAPGVIR